ncbi:UNVERIFIED_CONTAM: luciferase family oxidoreductase group 1 [Brevibacillus sp. OAP136]
MNDLRLSVLDVSPIYQNVSPHEALQQSLLLAQTADKAGYTRYWVPEHHDLPHLASSCPEVLLAHIGSQTSTIRIGSGAVLLPYYKPYKVAEAFALLATLYPDRIDLGIGRAPGGPAHASLALSESYLQQVYQMPALLQDVTALLNNTYQIDGRPVIARPIPPVPAQLWLLGTNRKSAEYAAAVGAGYVFGQFMSDTDGSEIVELYRSNYQATDKHPAPRAIMAIGVVCAETPETAEALGEEAKRWSGAASLTPESTPMPSTGKKMLVGTPEQIRSELVALQERTGIDEYMITTPIPDYEKRLRSYRLLAHAVLGE